KVKVNRQTDVIFLLVPLLAAGVILMLVVGIELHMLSYRKQATSILGRSAPFVILALVIGLERDIGYQMIGMNRECSFQLQSIAIAPFELRLPVQVGTASVGDQKSSLEGEV